MGEVALSAKRKISGEGPLSWVCPAAAPRTHSHISLGLTACLRITQVPDGVVSLGVSAIRKSVMARANFDIRNVNPLARCPKALQPAVFAHGTLDEIVALHHGESLFQVRCMLWLVSFDNACAGLRGR
jgi:hypothetical protein